MRVLSGSDKGRRLVAPQGSSTRPTTARVRSSLFDILVSRYDLVNTNILDLYAGSGALGIEALSRGASKAIFVDWSPKASRVLRQNILNLGVGDRSRLVRANALEYLQRLSKEDKEVIDFVFCDPPYEFSQWNALLELMPMGAVLVLESNREIDPPIGRATVKCKRYGGSVVTVLSPIEIRGSEN